MPHDGLHLVAGTAVMQTVLGAGVGQRESASPQRCCAAPAAMAVVRHDEQPTAHLFRCKPGKNAKSVKSVTVTFTNRFGEKYTQEIKL